MGKKQKKKERTPLGEHNGELFIELSHTGISYLVATIDGIRLDYFDGDDTPFMKIEKAIEWHRKEIEETRGKGGNRKRMEQLEVILQKFREGKVKIQQNASDESEHACPDSV